MPAIPEFRDSAGVLLAANFTLPATGAATPGAPSTPVELQLTNNLAGTGADPLIGDLVAQFRNAGETIFKTSGTEWADRHFVQARLKTGINITIVPTGWMPLGADAVIELPEMLNDEGLVFEVRIDAPGDAADPAEQIGFGVDPRATEPAPGSGDSVGTGVLTGYGDTRRTYIAQIRANIVENPGGADLDVQVPARVWIGAGEVYADHEELLTFTVEGAGDERLDLIVLKSDGTTAIIAGPIETAPATTEATPPQDSSPIALVRVDDTSVISDAKITQRFLPELGLFELDQSPTFPDVSFARGRALVDSTIVKKLTSTLVTLQLNQTNSVWLQRDRSFAISTDGVSTTPRALLLFEIVTDGVAVTAVVDRRHLLGFDDLDLVFRIDGALTGGQKALALLVSGRPARFLPLQPIVAAVDSLSSDATGGQTRIGIKADDGAGGALATIMEIGENEPEIAFDDADLRSTDAIPTTMTFPPFTLFEIEAIDELTGQTDDADGLTVVLRFAV